MASTYRIVCTEQEPANESTTHAHIVAVGIGSDPNAANHRWTLAQVLNAIDSGDTFYTRGTTSGKVATVEKVWCSVCLRYIIRTAGDAETDNNLDSLRRCSWKTS